MRTEDAIQHFGSAAALARTLGISRQSVHDWGDVVPEGRAYQIEILTDGALKAPRPDSMDDRAIA
jgi:DNA-binding transcriptional regulator YdaS (Cro superfamily)